VRRSVVDVRLRRAAARSSSRIDECLAGARSRPRISLGELASHSAGLPRLPLALVRRKGARNLTDPYADTTIDELTAHLAGVRVRRGARMRYSNFGAALLGQALAACAGRPYERLVEERVLGPLGVEAVWAVDSPQVAQPHDRRGRPVSPWALGLGAYAPAGCLHGTARGALELSMACLRPPPAMADAVALALTPRARRGRLECGLGWMRSPLARGARMWWHNGGTHGSRSFTGFVPEIGEAVAAVTNSARAPDRAAIRALRSAAEARSTH
jgi:D-alanyl-D-alanine-carboxypeptidase/D-alanyl-D-alanine-endopeptidase